MNVKKLLNTMNVTARRVKLGDLIDGKVDKVSGKGLSKNDYTDAEKTAVGTIGNKVDKAEGMGLSHNDFTDTYKNKLDAIIAAETSGSGGTE